MIRTFGRALVVSLLVLASYPVVAFGVPARPLPEVATTRHRHPATQAQASAALNRVQLLLHGTRAQSRAVQRRADASMLMVDLRLAYPALSPRQKKQADALLARPTRGPNRSGDPVYTGRVQKECDGVLCVHWDLATADAKNGVDPTDTDSNQIPDYVDRVMTTIEHVRSTYQDAGYRMPLDDSASANNGGDGETDIYLAQLADRGFYGYCTSDDPGLKQPNHFFASAYCVLDNNYTDEIFTNHTPLENLEVTAAHEFFHAVQFAYDIGEDHWIMEATATWAEDQLYTDINDNVQYLGSSPLAEPSVPIDGQGFGGFHWYGTWIFFRFLTERVVTDASGGLPVLVRDIWRRLDANWAATPQPRDLYSIQGVRSALAAHGIGFTRAVERFDVAARHPTRFFGEAVANSYPSAPARASTTLGPGHADYSTQFGLLHLSYGVLTFRPQPGMSRAWHLRVSLDLPDKSQGAAATLWITQTSGETTWRTIPLSANGAARFTLPFGSWQIRRVELEVINASPRFTGCWPPTVGASYYSCYAAHGIDDNLTNAVRATAYRS